MHTDSKMGLNPVGSSLRCFTEMNPVCQSNNISQNTTALEWTVWFCNLYILLYMAVRSLEPNCLWFFNWTIFWKEMKLDLVQGALVRLSSEYCVLYMLSGVCLWCILPDRQGTYPAKEQFIKRELSRKHSCWQMWQLLWDCSTACYANWLKLVCFTWKSIWKTRQPIRCRHLMKRIRITLVAGCSTGIDLLT